MSGYHRPTTLKDALDVMSAATAPLTLLAGGTDIYPARTARRAWDATTPDNILDLSAIAELRGIHDRADHWWIGATTTWSDIIAADLPPMLNALKAAAREIGGVQIQNRGTLGGNCCTASPAANSVPCLLALDAVFDVAGRARRAVPVASFYAGYRKNVLHSGEVLTGIRIPKRNGLSVFRKLGARRYLVISIAMVAGAFDWDERGNVQAARIAVGACSPVAQRLASLEDALRGKPLDPALVKPEHIAALTPIDDVRASAAYRRAAALRLVQDIIAEAAENQGGGRV
jgi:CO/xanthine dehydrogenase FAD-binding subunit